MRKKSMLVMGAGINDSQLPVYETQAAYKSWASMLERCYCAREQAEYPSYVGCTVDPVWLRFSNFLVWFDINYRPGYVLDKDILVPGNKHYGPNTCRYVPPYINTLILDRGRDRGDLPLGVTLAMRRIGARGPIKYRAQLMQRNKKICIGTYTTVSGAHNAYIAAKSAYVRDVADQYLSEGKIQHDIRDALVRRYLEGGYLEHIQLHTKQEAG